MTAGPDLGELDLRMIPALPMRDKPYGIALTSGDDFHECDAKVRFLCSGEACGSSRIRGK